MYKKVFSLSVGKIEKLAKKLITRHKAMRKNICWRKFMSRARGLCVLYVV